MRIEIQIRCESTWPSREELAIRNGLEDWLNRNVGKVIGCGGGMGAMDISLDLKEGESSVSQIKAQLQELGIDHVSEIKVLSS